MIRVFETFEEYVRFLTQLPAGGGVRLCSTFVPSGFFAKDSIARFFAKHERLGAANEVANLLWKYGKNQIKALRAGQAQMCIEAGALRTICTAGRVHEATPGYEIGFAERQHVVRMITPFVEVNIVRFADGPFPYTFRLYEPDGILIDVTRNVVDQRVQGMWVQHRSAFIAFALEFDRLWLLGADASTKQRSLDLMAKALRESL